MTSIKLYVDDVQVYPVETVAIPDEIPAIAYREDGYSDEMLHGIGVRSKFIDEFLDAAIAGDDPLRAEVASHMPRYFAVLVPGRYEKGDDLFKLFLNNWNRSYSWSAIRFGNFYIDNVAVPDVTMIRTGFNMENMHKTLEDRYESWFDAEVRSAGRSGMDLAELYRKKYTG